MFISLFIAILLIITAFMLIIPPDKTPSPHNFKPVSRIIIANVSIVGTDYMEKITYSPEDFSQILKNLSSVENSLLQDFKSRVSSYNIEMVDLKVRVLNDSYSLLLSCFVKGNVWSTSSGFTADMSWLINPLGLDLIDDHFEETNHSLEWKGNLQGIYTEIYIELPPQNMSYRAWQQPVGHCHAHIWWPS